MSEFFDRFSKYNAPAIHCEAADEQTIRRYEARLPVSLIEFWKSTGWCGYANGLIWFVNPSEYEDILQEWGLPVGSTVFARTAFADLVIWFEDHVQYLFAQYGKISKRSNLEIYVGISLTRKPYLDDVIGGKEFRKALKRLGPPRADECYGFVPALAMGGSGKSESIQKLKLREHLTFLVQIVGRPEPLASPNGGA